MNPGTVTVRTLETLALLTLALIVAGCKRHHAPAGPESGSVVFEGAGVLIGPGEEWKQHRDGELARSQWGDFCPPALEGQGPFAGGLIHAFLLARRSDPSATADSLRKEIETRAEVIRTSFRRDAFTADSGLRCIHIEYNQKAEDNGRKWLMRTHLYLVKNKTGRCIGISYVTPANKDAEAVHQMIRKTLAIQ